MGQVALGFRSLLIRAAVFFVMASLLAWALGGTLWPKPQTADLPGVQFDGSEWYWRVSVGKGQPHNVRWQLMTKRGKEKARPVDGAWWAEQAGPVVIGNVLRYGARFEEASAEPWVVVETEAGGAERITHHASRLAVEGALNTVPDAEKSSHESSP